MQCTVGGRSSDTPTHFKLECTHPSLSDKMVFSIFDVLLFEENQYYMYVCITNSSSTDEVLTCFSTGGLVRSRTRRADSSQVFWICAELAVFIPGHLMEVCLSIMDDHG